MILGVGSISEFSFSQITNIGDIPSPGTPVILPLNSYTLEFPLSINTLNEHEVKINTLKEYLLNINTIIEFETRR